MNVEAMYASEPYQELIQAVRANDQYRAAQIIEEQIAGTEGPHKAFWLLARFAQRAELLHPEDAWKQLYEAVEVGLADPYILRSALTSALYLAVRTERTDRLVAFMWAHRRRLRSELNGPPNHLNLGVLNILRGRWRKALRCFTGALVTYRQVSPHQQEAWKGYVPMFYIWRSITRVACGQVDEAESDIAAALRLYPECNPRSIHFLVLAIAKAEVALARGQLQKARAELQEGITHDGGAVYRRSPPYLKAQVELLAARIARAEGNQKAFAHFCDRALAFVRDQNLPWTEARIRAVLNGAER